MENSLDQAAEHLAPLLSGLSNFELRRPSRPRWSLDNMRALLARPGARLPTAPLVQVGGSKGKGTTCLYIEALARAVGMTTGTYLSPHLETLLERVRIDGRAVSVETLERALRPIVAHARSEGLAVTFFEVMTAAALSCFAGRGVDLGLLEVGLGGRLDATTAVAVAASVLTGVELEHTSLLGETIEAIAAEKVHIIRPDTTAFTAASGPALAVARDRAREVGADLQVLGEDFRLEEVEESADGFTGFVSTEAGTRHRFTLPGASRFELRAFALALACLRHLFPTLTWPLDPVPRPELPGRFEIVTAADGGPVILDAAHTEDSARALAAEIERRYAGKRVPVMFACGAEKRWQACLRALLPLADSFLVTGLVGTESAEPAVLLRWLRGQGVRARVVPDASRGLSRLLETSGVRLVTGSFYLVGAVRGLLKGEART